MRFVIKLLARSWQHVASRKYMGPCCGNQIVVFVAYRVNINLLPYPFLQSKWAIILPSLHQFVQFALVIPRRKQLFALLSPT